MVSRKKFHFTPINLLLRMCKSVYRTNCHFTNAIENRKISYGTCLHSIKSCNRRFYYLVHNHNKNTAIHKAAFTEKEKKETFFFYRIINYQMINKFDVKILSTVFK